MIKNKQKDFWLSKFSREYLKRNLFMPAQLNKSYKTKYGVSRTEMDNEFLKGMNKDIKILEVGCNFGGQLLCLSNLGFNNLYGIEINPDLVKISRTRNQKLNIIQGDVLDIPFKDSFFDLVFTSGLLIHISPKNIKKAISEIYRISSKYIWCFEYFSKTYTEIKYHGYSDVLWKADFSSLFLKNFKQLKLVKHRQFKYIQRSEINNKDVMFLLEKK